MYTEESGSARSRNAVSAVPYCAPWMSLGLSPSPVPLSGSLDVIDHYEASGKPLQHFIDVVNGRGYRYVKHWFPPHERGQANAVWLVGLMVGISFRLRLLGCLVRMVSRLCRRRLLRCIA